MREFGRNPANIEASRVDFKRDQNHMAALERARGVLNKGAINRKDFIDLYGQDSVDQDTALVEEYSRVRELQNRDPERQLMREKADILQGIIHENGPTWLGDRNIQMLRTDQYDDYENHIDEVVGFPTERTHHQVGLSMDVTFARDIEDKVQSIVQSVRSGKLGYVKYMVTKGGRGDLVTPRFLVSTDGRMVERLQRNWLRPKSNLGQDAFRFFMVDELVWQAQALKNFSHRVGQREAAEHYDDALYYLGKSARTLGQPSPEVAAEIAHDPAINRMKDLYKHWTR
jgi:hypothetical protein